MGKHVINYNIPFGFQLISSRLCTFLNTTSVGISKINLSALLPTVNRFGKLLFIKTNICLILRLKEGEGKGNGKCLFSPFSNCQIFYVVLALLLLLSNKFAFLFAIIPIISSNNRSVCFVG